MSHVCPDVIVANTPWTRTPSGRRRRWLVAALLVVAVLPACSSDDAATIEPGTAVGSTDRAGSEGASAATDEVPERGEPPSTDGSTASSAPGSDPQEAGADIRRQIGPRAVDVDRAMMLVVDSIETVGDDILVRVRVVNLSAEPLDVGVDDAIYGPLVVIRDDIGNEFPARAVEPAGVYSHAIGRFDLRVDGPFDADATEFVVEVATQRGPLGTDPVAPLRGDAVQWWSESPPVTFTELVAGDDGRTIEVFEVVDRGAYVEIAIRATSTSRAFSTPDDVAATLTAADGTELVALPPDVVAGSTSRTMAGVLRFPGTLSNDAAPFVLSVAGLDITIPALAPPATDIDPPRAGLPQLPRLIHAKIFNDPLPASTIIVDDESGAEETEETGS